LFYAIRIQYLLKGALSKIITNVAIRIRIEIAILYSNSCFEKIIISSLDVSSDRIPLNKI